MESFIRLIYSFIHFLVNKVLLM